MEWKKAESTLSPSPIDMTSSAGTIFIRKEITKVSRETDGSSTDFYEYLEAKMTPKEYEEYAANQKATSDDTMADIMLNQIDIINSQSDQDDTMADILLNTTK